MSFTYLLSALFAASALIAGQPESNQKTDLCGDSIPAGAIARLGTVRFRHGNSIYAACISPDGKMVASTGGHLNTNVWDATTGKKFNELSIPQAFSNDAVAFSPDGKTLAVGGGSGVCLFDPKVGSISHTLIASAYSVAFSPDGKLLAIGHESFGSSIWDVESGKKLKLLKSKTAVPTGPGRHSGRIVVFAIAFSPDGKMLAAAEESNVVLWDVATGRQQRILKADKENIFGLSFTPDGAHLATGGNDQIIRIWEVNTGKLAKEIQGHEDGVASLVFSPDGKTLISGSGAGSRKPGGNRTERMALRLWDVATGKQSGHLGEHGEGVVSLGLSNDGRTLMSAGGGAVRLWDWTSKREQIASTGHLGWVGSLAFSPDGERLATGGGDNRVILWNVHTGREIRQFELLKGDVDGLAFSRGGELIIANSRDGNVTIWDSDSGKKKRQFCSGEPQYSLALTPDGRTVAAGTWKGSIYFWDAETGMELKRLTPRKEYDEVHSLSFAPNGELLASSVFNQMDFKGSIGEGPKPTHPVRVWNLKRGVPFELVGHEGPTKAVAFSMDGKRIASAAWDGSLRLWETATRGLVWRFSPGARGYFNSLAFSPDGRLIACVGYSEAIYICDVATGKEIHRVTASLNSLVSVSFCPKGRFLAASGMDGNILLWDAKPILAKARPANETALTDEQLKAFWAELASEDAPLGHRAVWSLVATPTQTIPFFKEQLVSVNADEKRIRQLTTDLDSTKFADREKASKELEKLGSMAEAALRKAESNNPSTEAVRRIKNLLRKLDEGTLSSEQLRVLRVVEVLEQIGTKLARDYLATLAAGAPASFVAQESKLALSRVDSKNSNLEAK